MSMKTLQTVSFALALAVAGLTFGLAIPDPAAAWVRAGPVYQYPMEGGQWKYGFWDVAVRSYYTVDRCHGSTVVLNGDVSRSVDTAPGYMSIAEIGTVNWWGAEDAYYYRVC